MSALQPHGSLTRSDRSRLVEQSFSNGSENNALNHSIAFLFESLFRYKKRMFVAASVVIVLSWLVLLAYPRSYESDAKLVLKVGRESVALDPSATTSQTLMLQKTQEEEIRSATEILNSRHLLELVVDKIGPENVINGSVASQGGVEEGGLGKLRDWVKGRISDASYFVLTTAGVKDQLSDREEAIMKLGGAREVTAARKSNVINVHAESKSPEMAQLLVETIIDQFTDEYIKISRTSGSREFFETQVQTAQNVLEDSMDKRRDFMQSHSIVSIDANRNILKDQLAGIENDLIAATASMNQVQAEIDDLKTKAEETPSEIVASRSQQVDATWSGMRQKVYDLELSEQNLQAKYTSKHPILVATRKQLSGARNILAQLSKERVDSNTTPNPVRRRIQEDLQKLQTRLVGVRTLVHEKQAQRETMLKKVDELLKHEQQLAEFDRMVSHNETSLLALRGKCEEARVIDELQNQKISNVGIGQPATFVERPVSPKKKVVAAGAFMLMICFSVGVALASEFLDDRLRSGSQIALSLGRPVLGEVPHLSGFGPNLVSDSHRIHIAPISAKILSMRNRRRSSNRKPLVVGISSSQKGAGASSVAVALASACAKHHQLRTLLIDGNASNCTIENFYCPTDQPSLTEIVADESAAAKRVPVNQAVGFSVLAATESSSGFGKSSQSFASVFQHFDCVFVDLPSLTEYCPSVGLLDELDQIVSVVRADQTTTKEASSFLETAEISDLSVAGFVINDMRDPLPPRIRRLLPS